MKNEPANVERVEALAAKDRSVGSLTYGRLLWGTNIALLLATTAWIVFDRQFPPAASHLRSVFAVLSKDSSAIEVLSQPGRLRAAVLGGILIAAAASLLAIFVNLFWGAAAHRRLRSWFALTMLLAAWLTLLVSWPEFSWQGQRLRLRNTVSKFDALASELRNNWPTRDGEREGLGSFMAYPQGKPRMLMMLVSETDPQISAIERADDGSLGFEIRGEQPGTWLEWHPAGSTPKNFVGGLEAEFDLGRAAPLGGGWYLVRYR